MTQEVDENFDFTSIQEKNLELLQNPLEYDAPQESQNTLQESLQDEQDQSFQTTDIERDDVQDVLSNGEDPLLKDLDNSLFRKVLGVFQSIGKYILTASFIFVVLMLFSNYSAYITIAKSYFNPEAIAQTEKNMNKSIELSQIEIAKKDSKRKVQQALTKKQSVENYDSKSLRHIIGDIRTEDIELDIEIIPFVNRIVVPKIGKNIPLIDIAQGNVEGLDELNDIFMEELEGGVVRYPGSAKPGDQGNSFIFGHSSNFPWMPGEYNDVFALLDKLEIGDEIVSYYEGQKYTYKIHEKRVISPNDVEVLKRDTGKKEITLMTCWPIGTTYNRLLVIGELVK